MKKKTIQIGKILRELREEKGVSQKVVAKALNLAPTSYACYEQDVNYPPVPVIIALCHYYKVSADYLLGLED